MSDVEAIEEREELKESSLNEVLTSDAGPVLTGDILDDSLGTRFGLQVIATVVPTLLAALLRRIELPITQLLLFFERLAHEFINILEVAGDPIVACPNAMINT